MAAEVEENQDNEYKNNPTQNYTNQNNRASILSSITDMELPVLSFLDIISVTRCLMGLMVQFLAYFVMSFNTPLISNHLDQSGYSPIFMGASMITASACYIASMPLTTSLKKRMSKKGVLFIGLSLQSIGVMISGIDQIEKWYNPGFFSLFGISCIGLGTGCAMIPIMPEILEGIEERFQDNYDEMTLHNNMAGYFICCQALGETLGPLISSVLERSIEFRPTQKLLSVLVTAFLVIYLVSCGVPNFFTYKPPKSNNKEES